MTEIFSPDTISYIANWCTILAFIGIGGYAVTIGVKMVKRNLIKNRGDHNNSAQTESGPVSQNGTQHVYNAPVTIYGPGVEAPSASPTAVQANPPASQHKGDSNG